MNSRNLMLLALLAALDAAGSFLIRHDQLTVNALQYTHAAAGDGLTRRFLFVLLCVLIAALSIPGPTLLTLPASAVLPFRLALLLAFTVVGILPLLSRKPFSHHLYR